MKKSFLTEILKKIATFEDYIVYAIDGNETLGFVITPQGNVLTVKREYFDESGERIDGVRFTFNYVPSRGHDGSGACDHCSITNINAINHEKLKILEIEGLEYTKKLKVKLYENSNEWMDSCYWKDKLREVKA